MTETTAERRMFLVDGHLARIETALNAALNQVDGDGSPPDWDYLRLVKSKLPELRAIAADAASPGSDADMRAFGASDAACCKWPDDTPEHRACRAAYVEGAAASSPSVTEEEIAEAICCPGGCLRKPDADCWAGRNREEREQTSAVMALIRG